jgi:hypothetical protein
VLIDATESPIQRPKKKAKEILFRKEKERHNENTTCYE